jgi:sugar/nucleoside kinase (ribokinase family)
VSRVLVVGDANLDLVLRGDVEPRFGQAEQLLDGADLVLGSSAGICAAGLARLGLAVDLVARVGDDLFGEHTRRLLTQAGVGTASVMTDAAPTGLSVILSAASDRSILTLPGALAALTAADVRAAVARAAPGHVHFASLFLLPALAPDLPGLLAELGAAGITTSLDTNWDPAERWRGIAPCLPNVDLLLPNAAEAVALARALGSRATDAADAAGALASRGPVVAVKNGAAGGFAVSPEGLVEAPGLDVEVVDTTGAGDSFDAGFLAAWLRREPLALCVRSGAVAGSLSTRGAGGTSAQASAEELAAAIRVDALP